MATHTKSHAPNDRIVMTEPEAKQGVNVNRLRYVLVGGLVGAALAGMIVLAWFWT